MKKLILFICVLFSISVFSQRTGISYQALIINPNGEQLPGYNNQNAPLVNTAICLEFVIQDDNNTVEYSEYQSVTTDKYGMVNLIIGTGDYAGGYSGGWNGIVWSEKSKKLKVNLDITAACSRFTEISNQDLTSVPFALFAPGQEGRDGESAYEIWLAEGNVGTVLDFLESLKGEKGEDGLSAFQIWKDLGNEDTEEDFIDSLKGDKGEDGKSAYQIWIGAGNDGTEEDFLNSLKGDGGIDSVNTLVITTNEEPGDNCKSGGVKIEYGRDINRDGVLQSEEIDETLTQYICNGIANDGTKKGNTTFWDGEKWVVDNNQLFNDGENIMIGTDNVVSSSLLTLASTSRGVLIPRMTSEQKGAIENPANGLLVYQIDGTPGFYYYDGSSWTPLKSQNSSSGSGSDTNTLIYTADGF